MENNTDTKTVQSSDFKQELVKLAITAFAGCLANKLSGKLVDRMFDRRRKVVPVEIVTQ